MTRQPELRPNGPVATYDAIIRDCRDKASNAARRNKPTMWAYYLDMVDGLSEWFSDVGRDDGGFAGAALALSQIAERDCPNMAPQEAARLWALSVYSRRILNAWHPGPHRRASLRWLHERAETA